MGGSRWSDDAYSDRASIRASTNTPTFDYSDKVKSGAVATKVHTTLDPLAIKGVRESRDSKEHPESNAIVVTLDVTGSMAAVVSEIYKKLPSLMGLLIRRNYISDPQVMFMAIGDATCDKLPLQVGQFESGIEMEDNLTNFVLEQGGGGQQTESYELAAYVGAKKTALDCLEKRGKKGYFFFIGDEMPYTFLKKDEVKDLLGDALQDNLKSTEIFSALQEKYNVFFILPEDASNGHDKNIINHWKQLIGAEHVILLPKAEAVAELIGSQIGLCEGATDVEAVKEDLTTNGLTTALAKVVTDALSTKVTPTTTLAKSTGDVEAAGSTSIKRL